MRVVSESSHNVISIVFYRFITTAREFFIFAACSYDRHIVVLQESMSLWVFGRIAASRLLLGN